tara:strand:+ start:466 stop:1029 length:564 start_codon:yes stop_codon:yes gene_type:complete
MKKFYLFLFIFFVYSNNAFSKDDTFFPDDLFHIDHMNSHNENFALYFKGREKSILARGENSNYINDYPNDLYIYDYSTKSSTPLISYEWFPSQAKYFLQEYDFPVFPDDFAYYLLKDNRTLVMISAVKSLNANFKFDISKKELELYPTNGKFDFIISSFSKNCGHNEFKDNYKCSIYKPLISSNLIN